MKKTLLVMGGFCLAMVLVGSAAYLWKGDWPNPLPPSPPTPDVVVPDQKIVGADKPFSVGEMVELSVSPADPKPSYRWKVIDLASGAEWKYGEKTNGGIYFGTGQGDRRLMAVCSTKNSLIIALITIGKPSPPPPPPAPDFEPGKYGMAKFVWEAANTKVNAGENREKGAKALSDSFKSIAGAIRAGGIKEPKEVLEKSKTANDSALKNWVGEGAIKEWEGFSELLQDKLFAIYKNGEFKEMEDWATCWMEISIGLGKVK